MKILSFLLLSITFSILSGCTYSITMVHTEGVASDVVDEAQSATPNTVVSPTVTIPIEPKLV